jgi:guanylate kinase
MKDLLPQGVKLQGEGGIAFVIAGPSGAGKSSVISALLSRDQRLRFSVSATTRPPRPTEVHGRDYYFVSEEEFDQLVAQGALLEWTVYQGHRYGTPRAEVVERLKKRARRSVKGGGERRAAIRRANLGFPVVLIFLVPPSWEELAKRVRGRERKPPRP